MLEKKLNYMSDVQLRVLLCKMTDGGDIEARAIGKLLPANKDYKPIRLILEYKKRE